MIITDVAPLDNRRQKVYIDGQYAFPLYLSELKKFHIQQNVSLEQDIYDELEKLLVKRIKERILYLIGDMDKTERDIRRKMTMAGYNDTIVGLAVDELKSYGIIDDRRFARVYAESLRDNRGKSRRIIEGKLYEKGVPREIIQELMEDIDIDERQQLIRALNKKGYTCEQLAECDQNQRRKLYASLARMGFSPSLISECFKSDFFYE